MAWRRPREMARHRPPPGKASVPSPTPAELCGDTCKMSTFDTPKAPSPNLASLKLPKGFYRIGGHLGWDSRRHADPARILSLVFAFCSHHDRLQRTRDVRPSARGSRGRSLWITGRRYSQNGHPRPCQKSRSRCSASADCATQFATRLSLASLPLYRY